MPLTQRLKKYRFDQNNLSAFLEAEEECSEEYLKTNSRWHYLADIGEIIKAKKPQASYQLLRKFGFGHFSLAWLAVEKTNGSVKAFRALKIFKARVTHSSNELNVCFTIISCFS